ncbi:MAG: hypothetical protein HY369_02960 [Candidatus Aenigmarchaeota archaeon]|nr:hypothetical protein [Candidatus Aenigmarchaeota archaeon]
MKGMSSLISTVLLIAIVFGLATVISPWAFKLSTDVANQTQTTTLNQITCQSAKYDFDSSFATNGINYTFSGSDKIDAKVVNTGTINLHGFSLEAEIQNGSSISIKQLTINQSSQKTAALPLKPGQSAILIGNISEDLSGTLLSLKVLNGVCPEKFITLDV